MIGLDRVVGVEADNLGERALNLTIKGWGGNTSKTIAGVTYVWEHL